MLKVFIPAVALGLALSGTAIAQSSTNTPSGSHGAASSGAQSNATGTGQQNLATANKVKQDLQNAGFKDVNVVAESFVVQAKTKDGDPVIMTIGPHGFTAFEEIKGANTQAGSTGSTGSSTSGSQHK